MTDNIYERLAQIEANVRYHEQEIGTLRDKVSSEADTREGQAKAISRLNALMGALGSRTLKLRESLANHDTRLSNLEGEERQAVLEAKGPGCGPGPAAFQSVLNELRGIQSDLSNNVYTLSSTLFDRMSKDLLGTINRLSDLLKFQR